MFLLHIFIIIITSLRYICESLLFILDHNLHLLKLIFILFFCFSFNYFRKKKYKLSTIRKKKNEVYSRYKINDYNDLDISISIVYLYILIFIIGIFTLRIKNMERLFDLMEYYTKICTSISLLNFFDLSLNFILLLIIIIIYIVLFFILAKQLKYHFLRLYYYLFLAIYTKHTLFMLNLKNYLNLDYYITQFTTFYLPQKLQNYPKLERFLFIHIYGLRYIIQRFFLLFIIIFDIFFNNMILEHMFKFLPVIFIYEIWCKFSIFLTGLNLEYDKVIAILLYGEVSELDYDQECLYLNDVPYEKKVLREILFSYAYNDSVDKFFLPQNPVSDGIFLIFKYWQNLFLIKIKTTLEEKRKKYSKNNINKNKESLIENKNAKK